MDRTRRLSPATTGHHAVLPHVVVTEVLAEELHRLVCSCGSAFGPDRPDHAMAAAFLHAVRLEDAGQTVWLLAE